MNTMEKIKHSDEQDWNGKTIADVCALFGKPDSVESAEHYSAKFLDQSPSVVMTYAKLKKRWYIAETGYVIGVLAIKE